MSVNNTLDLETSIHFPKKTSLIWPYEGTISLFLGFQA